MTERLLGIETEYALTGLDANGEPIERGIVLERVMAQIRARLPHLPDVTGRGVFLGNGARFYIDVPDHPEFTTPECADPWAVVQFIQAGERILARLATELTGRGRRIAELVILRCNVDYSGSGSTWGTHESVQHRADPRTLPAQIIPHLVSRIIYTGAGGFNSRCGSGIEFTLSPRVPHLEHVISDQSTHARGIFHTKDEPLSSRGYHRLHILCGESLSSELASWLKVGTTALVVALIEGGLKPGDAVQLQSPLAAMRTFAGDPTCQATVPSNAGADLSALAIQRHYLEMAEAHLEASCMPPWAAAVCQGWRAMLDRLEGAPDSVTETLDWAIKLALFKNRARQRGISWEALPHWNHVAQKLSDALIRSASPDKRPPVAVIPPTVSVMLPTVAVILDERGPVAEEVRRLTPYMRQHRLEWERMQAFIELRQELFEIDTRFGQLGDKSIFAALDRAGVLTHRVVAVGNVEHAMEHPPAVGRARLRGHYVRELSGAGDRYTCDWHGLWDHQGNRRLDLADPFAASAEWQPWIPDDGPGTVMLSRLRRARSG